MARHRGTFSRLLSEAQPEDIVLLPAEALNSDGLFIDSVPLAEVEQSLLPARVVTGYEVTATLRSL